MFDWDELDKLEEEEELARQASLPPCAEQSSRGLQQREQQPSTKGPHQMGHASTKGVQQGLSASRVKTLAPPQHNRSGEVAKGLSAGSVKMLATPQHNRSGEVAKGLSASRVKTLAPPQHNRSGEVAKGRSTSKAIWAVPTPKCIQGWENLKWRWQGSGLSRLDAEYLVEKLKQAGWSPSDAEVAHLDIDTASLPDFHFVSIFAKRPDRAQRRPSWLPPGQCLFALGDSCLCSAFLRDMEWRQGSSHPGEWSQLTLKHFTQLAQLDFKIDSLAEFERYFQTQHSNPFPHGFEPWVAKTFSHRMLRLRDHCLDGSSCGLHFSGFNSDGSRFRTDDQDVAKDAKSFMGLVKLRLLVVVKLTDAEEKWKYEGDRVWVLYFWPKEQYHGFLPHWLGKEDSRRLRQYLEPKFRKAFEETPELPTPGTVNETPELPALMDPPRRSSRACPPTDEAISMTGLQPRLLSDVSASAFTGFQKLLKLMMPVAVFRQFVWKIAPSLERVKLGSVRIFAYFTAACFGVFVARSANPL